jgi:hypothetical protein
MWNQFLGSEIEATAYVTARALERFGNQADDVEIMTRPVTSVRPMADGRRVRAVVMASLNGEFPAIMAMVDGSPLHALPRLPRGTVIPIAGG